MIAVHLMDDGFLLANRRDELRFVWHCEGARILEGLVDRLVDACQPLDFGTRQQCAPGYTDQYDLALPFHLIERRPTYTELLAGRPDRIGKALRSGAQLHVQPLRSASKRNAAVLCGT
jgi:hypothetical protein